jgi:hypothetical protein
VINVLAIAASANACKSVVNHKHMPSLGVNVDHIANVIA